MMKKKRKLKIILLCCVESLCYLLLDAHPTSPSILLDNTGHPAPDHQMQVTKLFNHVRKKFKNYVHKKYKKETFVLVSFSFFFNETFLVPFLFDSLLCLFIFLSFRSLILFTSGTCLIYLVILLFSLQTYFCHK